MINSAPKSPGVYRITCVATGKCYIGSSKNLHSRLSQHLRSLRNGSHQVRALQADYKRHGKKAFSLSFELHDLAVIKVVEESRIKQAMQSGATYNSHLVRKLNPPEGKEAKVRVTVSLPQDLYEWLVADATAENRNICNYLINVLALKRGANA